MVLGVHFKSRARDANGKRKQWWGDYAANLPARGNGKQPGDPARVVPFGMEVSVTWIPVPWSCCAATRRTP